VNCDVKRYWVIRRRFPYCLRSYCITYPSWICVPLNTFGIRAYIGINVYDVTLRGGIYAPKCTCNV
jgi:hypothetical protein